MTLTPKSSIFVNWRNVQVQLKKRLWSQHWWIGVILANYQELNSWSACAPNFCLHRWKNDYTRIFSKPPRALMRWNHSHVLTLIFNRTDDVYIDSPKSVKARREMRIIRVVTRDSIRLCTADTWRHYLFLPPTLRDSIGILFNQTPDTSGLNSVKIVILGLNSEPPGIFIFKLPQGRNSTRTTFSMWAAIPGLNSVINFD